MCTSPSHTAADEPPFGGEFLLEDVLITMSRGPCYGRCPVYTVTITGTGLVTYSEGQLIGSPDDRNGQVSVKKVVSLLNTFIAERFWDARECYKTLPGVSVQEDGKTAAFVEAIESDHPTTILTLRIGRYEKRVSLSFGYPSWLGKLAKKVDRVAGTKKWVAKNF